MNNTAIRKMFEIKQSKTDDCIVEVYLNGLKVYEWDDSTVVDSSEDLVWLRDISELFFDAVRIGIDLALKEIHDL